MPSWINVLQTCNLNLSNSNKVSIFLGLSSFDYRNIVSISLDISEMSTPLSDCSIYQWKDGLQTE